MNIIVCLKQIILVYSRTGRDAQQNYISPEDQIRIVNPNDEWALEMALQLKEQLGDTRVDLVTAGPMIAEESFRRCLAMGGDQAFHLDASESEISEPWRTAGILAQFIKTREYNLILCGERSLDDEKGCVGPFLAELLGFPFVGSVVEVDAKAVENKLRVYRRLERGDREVIEVPLPSLLAFYKGTQVARYSTVPSKIAARAKPIEKVVIRDSKLDESIKKLADILKLGSVSSPSPRPKWIFTPDPSLPPHERIRLILSKEGGKGAGKIVKESPEESARKLLKFLEGSDLISLEG